MEYFPPVFITLHIIKMVVIVIIFKIQAEAVLNDTVELPSKSSQNQLSKKKKKEIGRDENYIPHFASDQHTEMGFVCCLLIVFII